MEFDVVVVGAGTAGCMVARQIALRTEARIAIVEAGPRFPAWALSAPLASLRVRPYWSWTNISDPIPSLNHRTVSFPMGRVVGGTSSVNAMIAAAGPAEDYEAFAPDRTARSLFEPSLRKQWLEEQGIVVESPRYESEFTRAFLAGCQEQGIQRVEALDGSTSETCGLFELFQHNARRWSSAQLLREQGLPSTITVIPRTSVRRLMVKADRVVGLEVLGTAAAIQTIQSRFGVILAAGAIHSPCILQRSGIGSKETLDSAGIPMIKELFGVGRNLQDHLGVPWVVSSSVRAPGRPSQWIPAAMRYAMHRRGVMVSNCCEAGCFLGSKGRSPEVEVFTHFQTSKRAQAVEFSTILLHPKSRGKVSISAEDPWGAPRIEPNYLDSPDDMQRLIHGVQRTVEIANGSDLLRFGLTTSQVGEVDEPWVRKHASTYYHPGGTCRMGLDELGVVALDFQVHGIQGLWVADNSVVPALPGGHTAMTALWIGALAGQRISNRINSMK